MSLKNKVQVMIGGKTMTLVGTEPEEYLKEVAEYINEKIEEVKAFDSSKALSPAAISVLTSINIADAYLKENEKLNALALENESIKLKVFDLARENDKSREALQKEIELLKRQNESLKKEMETLTQAAKPAAQGEYGSKPVLGSISHTKNR